MKHQFRVQATAPLPAQDGVRLKFPRKEGEGKPALSFQCNSFKVVREKIVITSSKFLHRPLPPYPPVSNEQSEKLLQK